MYFYSKLTYEGPIHISRPYASIDTVNFRRMINGLKNENLSEEDQDVFEKLTKFLQATVYLQYIAVVKLHRIFRSF